MHADLAEASLDAGFALLRLAESQRRLGARRDARKTLREASAAEAEGRVRLRGAENGTARKLAAGFDQLGAAVARASAGAARPTGSGRARILQMPPRGPDG